MFPNTTEPTEILHNAYLIIRFFPIDIAIEYAAVFWCGKLNHVYFHGG